MLDTAELTSNTHLAIDAEWVGTPVSLRDGHARVSLTTHARMAADARGLVQFYANSIVHVFGGDSADAA